MKKIFIKTFGCIQNTADSQKIKAFYWDKGFEEVDKWQDADLVVINTCIIRESAENRAYGLIDLVNKWNKKNKKKIDVVVTGCLAGLANRDKTGKKLRQLKRDFPIVSKFLSIEEVNLDMGPVRDKKDIALIPISFGCSNFCSYCIVPFARGPEKSIEMEKILNEIDEALKQGFKKIMLIGQNVNSYGADLTNTTLVSMGKKRFKSLFPKLLEVVVKKDLEKISFVSSNPWDFSDELIKVIADNKKIDRLIHLPIQSGDNGILKKMNRGYTSEEYMTLIKKIRNKVKGIKFSTDIIIGFPGEDEKAFQNTVKICKEADFEIAYLNKYSPRKGTVSEKLYEDEITQSEKKRRWNVLNKLINQR